MASSLITRSMTALAQAGFAPVTPGYRLRFPADEGSHPAFRTEWWYVTGWLDEAAGPLGFQITFFRTRPHPDTGNPSRFNPRDILIAHAALSERAHGRLRHAERVARAGFGLAEAKTGSMDVRIDDWALGTRNGAYTARIAAEQLDLDLNFEPTQPPMLQGQQGYSRKGPRPASASYYYSLPHLAVHGQIRAGDGRRRVRGFAWLDHEWSSEYLDPAAVGWDWTGINLDGGGALMAFRMRGRDGSALWAAATVRQAAGATRTFAPEQVRWSVQRWWRSPRTGADYPVAVRIDVGDHSVELEPLLDDQENDTRLSTGAVYWEGAVTARVSGKGIGRGYLELTGYAGRLRM